MAIFKEVQDSFDEVIPGAAKHADTFLDVIQRRCNKSGIGIELAAAAPDRKQPDRIVMQGSVTFGNAWKGKRPYTLQVYADPVGKMLQVGWQVITSELGGVLSNSRMFVDLNNKQAAIHNDPNTIRQLTGILQAFHKSVFLPTLQNVVDAVEVKSRGKGFSGV